MGAGEALKSLYGAGNVSSARSHDGGIDEIEKSLASRIWPRRKFAKSLKNYQGNFFGR